MNSFELIPTEENLIQALKENILRRNKDLTYFYDLLLAQETASSIAIDGRWGSGKTFFVKQSMLLINAKNPMSEMEEEKRKNILCSVPFRNKNEDIQENYELAVYYDAWENDNDIDPILSIVYEITKQLGIEYSFKDDSNLFKIAGSVLEALSGRSINGIIENLKSEAPLKKLEEEKEVQKNIKKFFSELLIERGNRLVVFIDELDRCKPSYAVQLLERIKHYLCDDRITFVFSVNLKELQHTIRHYYGNTFDACRYLDRFFDIRITLPPADKREFYRKFGFNEIDILEEVCRKIIETYNMELREITRFYRQVKTAVHKPMHQNEQRDFLFPDGRGRQLMLIYIVPILIGLETVDISLHDEFVSGKNAQPLMELYKESEIGSWLARGLLNSNESFEKADDKRLVTIEEKLNCLYNAIFVTEYTGNIYCMLIGQYRFDNNSKNFVKSSASMLSEYADFEI